MNFAVIFDMDGVLVDNGTYHYQAWKIFCDKFNIPFSEEKFRTVFFCRTIHQLMENQQVNQLKLSW